MRTCNCLHRARLSPEASARASAKAVTALLMPLLEAITTLLTATLGQQPFRKLSGGCSGKAVRIGTTHAAHIHRGSSSAPLEQREPRKTGRREVSGAPRRTSSWRPSRLRTLHGLPNIRDALLHEHILLQQHVVLPPPERRGPPAVSSRAAAAATSVALEVAGMARLV